MNFITVKPSLLGLLLALPCWLLSQNLEQHILDVQSDIKQLESQQKMLEGRLEELKLQKVQRDLRDIGFPSENYILHTAMALEYDEEHEQAKWVAHIITPDIIEGKVFRSNDFRPDPKVKTGTAVEEDYFLKYLQPDSSYQYDGYGYDRGHLAPSADFRWSQKALSESYFYSNMSPQRPEFNRESWADLETRLRGYIFDHPTAELYVVTGPVLTDGLPKVERSVNQVSIPGKYFKVALDLKNKRAIGFIMPNQKCSDPLASYAVTVNEVEELTGLDFFNALPDEVEDQYEAKLDKKSWLPDIAKGDVDPIKAPSLAPNHFNTVQAKRYMGSGDEIQVCGTVVSTRYSRSGNLWLNIDKQFPNQIFSVFIRKKDLPNFSYKADEVLANTAACFYGKVQDFNGTPTMNINREEHIKTEVPRQ
ncbi:MAG: DNA/RNA non-specific endonuclease [Saprospiraceae bacterium]|nr:DNA/RNA non-specific endonuclease [Saprospiraceae bacterium]